MKIVMILGLAVSFINISLASLTTHRALNGVKPKRALLSCLETYGGGSITCGDADSLFCYDPTVGDTCCAMDNGYCKVGDFCAPVAGFCCTIGEDPETCAVRLDFTLPPAYSIAIATIVPSGLAASAPAPTTSTTAKEATSTSTIQIKIASSPTGEANLVVGTATLDTDGMIPQFTAPVGNKITLEYTAPINATSSAEATKTASGNVLAYTGAAVVNRITGMGSPLGLLIVLTGMAL
ncbi:hypothetical protein VTL71DRAFT_4093 [Oculimacula yallundae]|uniref:Uncharacterized protein n=1 Tax=Oculimacula yallundae TaxID=86028 RepID=A0ABR4C4U3_9HELO